MSTISSVQTPDSGAADGVVNNVCPATDPKVQEAVDRTVQASGFPPEPSMAVTYQISETMNDQSLTQEQKDTYIAQLLGMANGGPGCAAVTPEQAKAINGAFNEIATAYTNEATPELRQQVADSIARSVAAGSLGSNEIYGLVKSGAPAARELLTGVQDARVLADVSQRLLADAQREGYDINRNQRGPALLTAAADIANMAAAQGDASASDAVLGEIERVTKLGPVAGDMTLVQAMMATTLIERADLPARDGFHVLASLLGTSSSTPTNQEAQDRLFAALARSGNDRYVGGIDQSGERTSALNHLGEYFDKHFARLAETDWRKANTGDFHHGLVQDFMRHVLLDASYGRVNETNDAIATHMHLLAGDIGNTRLSADQREEAASTLGTIMGSLQAATADYIAHARGDAEAKVNFIRSFTDILTDKLISKGTENLPGADDAAKGFVDEIWKGITDWMASGEIARAEGVTGGMLDLSRIFRNAMSNGESFLLNAFDLRVELYYDP